eukprot:TRINITY_DN6617_c0_g1_i1.p1 TRINITY_DN6617_c0_g1~~TRINITY_DN6617_c0_g1_i1.p1  ORF type:complete len:457 (-),score=69.21 TRINITY_DN6617_c0_g1_i1:1088-2458(-)
MCIRDRYMGITYQQFLQGIQTLNKNIYSEEILGQVWRYALKKIGKPAELDQTINKPQFGKVFSFLDQNQSSTNTNTLFSKFNCKYTGLLSKSLSNTTLIPRSEAQLNSKLSSIFTYESIYDKFKNLLLASGKDIVKSLKELDYNQTGFVSNVQFRHLLMQLNLGLGSKDIDKLISLSNSANSDSIDWKNFLLRTKLNENETQLEKRSENRLQKLKKSLYAYMISPKDAFRMYDEQKKGMLSLNQFTQLMNKISQLEGSEFLSFAVIKDVFDFIDIKKDGYLDQDEWVESFARFDVQRLTNPVCQSSQILKSLPSPANKLYKPKLKFGSNINIQDFYKTMQYNSIKWEKSYQYDQVIILIARNRKLLKLKFKQVQQNQVGTKKPNVQSESKFLDQDTIIQILNEFLQQNGIQIQSNYWPVLINFAKTKQLIDYKLLLNVYRQRCDEICQPPPTQVKK